MHAHFELGQDAKDATRMTIQPEMRQELWLSNGKQSTDRAEDRHPDNSSIQPKQTNALYAGHLLLTLQQDKHPSKPHRQALSQHELW
jgi:hypothetical protein